MQMNELLIAGFVGRDAEDNTTKGGTRIVTFNVCHTVKGKNGAKDVNTWVRAKVFGTWCDTAAGIKKGDNVLIKGPICLNEFTGKDGTAKSSLEIIANTIGLLKKSEARSVAAPVEDYSDIPF